ncbi:MAG TPA: 2-C-methyl-D-erythritol 2,4-cyclodiphosphate synthase [Bacteroidales bacterium]|nr:2-C-methyl-D-erythritol 2,4-cyclodiphosphate synthase [Bacteroidales bacterium]HNS47491.1 2-C-methyl-D-erythritol 2,4-cyclodiphosphate synthase [Bacteroidales bacterium]
MKNSSPSDYRTGFGYDIHRLTGGRALILGGTLIPHPKGSEGHSDADVLIHAICDALLGAAGLRDIGYHFPDTAPEFKGIDSKILLRRTLELVREQGYQLVNLDATIVLEKPKLQPHIPAMKTVLAEILGTEEKNIAIKAKTNEGLGPIGHEEAVAAFAIASLFHRHTS